MLSAFDNNGSYDQIGFDTYYNGVWGLTYTWTTGPLDGLQYYPVENYNDQMNLSMGSTYTVSITVQDFTAVFTLARAAR
jgi:hypothetical protein